MSDYVPTDWVDDVTPVDAARMDKIEQGIDVNRDAVISLDGRLDTVETSKENKSEKGAANGYAPLGADTKVPTIYLPTGGSGAVEYENAWAVGTAYQPGDVVIHNGVEYLAVNPSTGQTPPASPAPVAGSTVIPLVTTLPASPFDGQTVDFTDSLTTPSWVWRLRYVAAAPSNKWKFVGGAPLMGEVLTSFSPGTSYQSDGGPSLTIPVAGYYLIEFGCEVGAYANDFMRMSFAQAPAAPADADSMLITPNVTGVSTVHTGSKAIRKTLTAVPLVFYYKAGNVSRSFQNRWGKVTPIGISG